MTTSDKSKKEILSHVCMVRLSESQWQDLKTLAKKRKETQSDSLRSCLEAVINQAKRKGMWEDGHDSEAEA